MISRILSGLLLASCVFARAGDPVMIGACCLPDGSCQNSMTAFDCQAAGGTYQGDGTTCGSIECPGPEACCFPNGACQDLTADACILAGGTPGGPATSCFKYACPQPPEACCLPDGSCVELAPNDCVNLGGSPQGPGMTCATAVCAQPEACCLPDGTCSNVTPDTCTFNLLGIPMGFGTTCSSVTNPVTIVVTNFRRLAYSAFIDSTGWCCCASQILEGNTNLLDGSGWFSIQSDATPAQQKYWYDTEPVSNRVYRVRRMP